MAKPYSMDLRERVVEAVERDGLACNQAAGTVRGGGQHGIGRAQLCDFQLSG
jgi:transposase